MSDRELDVLIVDDDPIVVHAIEGTLRGRCACRVALNGERALELMRRKVPDIVLLDVDMPGRSGFDVLQAMREDPLLEKLPALMITSHADEAFHRRALDGGAVDYLVKPVSSTILQARVDAHVRMSRATKALRAASSMNRQELEQALADLEASHKSLAASVSQLDEANARLRQFVHIASHDLREPLNTIDQFSQLIQSDFPQALPVPAARYLDHVRTGAQRMRTLLDDIVRYANLQDSQREAPSAVNLDALLHGLRQAMAASIAASGARLLVEPLPPVRGVESELVQLFQCLLSNALKFHEPGVAPSVHVHAVAKAGQWAIHVRDDGIGMSQEDAQRVLQPFVRLHRRARFDGSGLGLTIAQEIAARHGTSIEVISSPAQGADFWVTLPAA